MRPDLRVKVPDTPLGAEVEQGTTRPASNEQSVPAEPRGSSWPLLPQEVLGATLSRTLLLFS